MTHIPFFSDNRLFRAVFCCLGLIVSSLVFSGSAIAGGGNLPPEVQKGVSALLALQNPAAALPDAATLDGFLKFTTSPVNPKGVDDQPPYPDGYEDGDGVFWRSRLRGVPLATALEYLCNPKVPMTVVYPSSIRYSVWQPGADILNLPEPLWKQFGRHADKPLVLRGVELEEITPDNNTGAYYKYTLDRVLALTEYQGRQVLLSLSWQKGESEVGKKAATIGDYANWDFVYSKVTGTLARGLGWAESYIYSSASVIVLYEDAPGGKDTCFAMYRWMDAGWSGLNMVKRSHISAGAERSFAGLKAFMESPNRPTPAAIDAHIRSLQALDLPALQARFAPYGAKVEESAATVDALRSDDFQKIIKDGGYGKSMTKDELIAAIAVNFIKQQLGKPLLAGPLDGK